MTTADAPDKTELDDVFEELLQEYQRKKKEQAKEAQKLIEDNGRAREVRKVLVRELVGKADKVIQELITQSPKLAAFVEKTLRDHPARIIIATGKITAVDGLGVIIWDDQTGATRHEALMLARPIGNYPLPAETKPLRLGSYELLYPSTIKWFAEEEPSDRVIEVLSAIVDSKESESRKVLQFIINGVKASHM